MHQHPQNPGRVQRQQLASYPQYTCAGTLPGYHGVSFSVPVYFAITGGDYVSSSQRGTWTRRSLCNEIRMRPFPWGKQFARRVPGESRIHKMTISSSPTANETSDQRRRSGSLHQTRFSVCQDTPTQTPLALDFKTIRLTLNEMDRNVSGNLSSLPDTGPQTSYHP